MDIKAKEIVLLVKLARNDGKLTTKIQYAIINTVEVEFSPIFHGVLA